MEIDFDVLQASFWSLTYVLIVFYNLRHHILGIPPIAISSTKLIGDLCAWVYYKSFSPAVFYIGLIVSLLNLICLGNTLLPLIHRAESRPPEVNA